MALQCQTSTPSIRISTEEEVMMMCTQHFILNTIFCIHLVILSDIINNASALLARYCNKHQSHHLAASPIIQIPSGILGPPEPLESLDVGQSVNAFRSLTSKRSTSNKHDFIIQRLSHSPHIFLLHNFLSPEECANIQHIATVNGMAQAQTVSENDRSSRKYCQVAWLNSHHYADINDLVTSTINIFLSKHVKSHPMAGVEDLQVLKYSTGGEFIHHHDGEPRIMTVVYYLNGIAGTWFPLATFDRNSIQDSERQSIKRPRSKRHALELANNLHPGKDGLLVSHTANSNNEVQTELPHSVKANPGDAVVFYNYLDDGSGQLDWNSLHCGLPTQEGDGPKWIANHWYRLNNLESISS